MQHPIAAIVSFLMTGDTHLLSDACGDELVEGDEDQNALTGIEEMHDAVGDGQSGGRESEVEAAGSVETEILRAITDHIPITRPITGDLRSQSPLPSDPRC